MPLSEFAPPWFEGQVSTVQTVPRRWPVAIGGHGYMVEPELYERTFVPVQRDQSDDTTEPGEQTLSSGGLWRRSQSDWALGAGQLWLDQEESTRRRFRESLGIDPWGDSHATLLPTVEEKRSSASSNLQLLVAGPRLYVADNQTVIFSDGVDSEQNATWVTGWTTATGLPAASVLDMASSGSHVYILMGDNSIYRATIGTTAFALYYNPAAVATRLWIALGRLFISDGRTIYEVSSTPGETSVFQHPDPNMVWSALVGTPSGIFLAGNIGQNGEIRRLVVNTSGSGFDVPIVGAEFRNEQVHALAAAGLNLLIGTSVGWRYAPIAGDSAGLDYGPLVEVGAVRNFAVDTVDNETFVWFTWSNIVAGASGLGRVRLFRFTAPKVPAYASDVYSAAGGTSLAVASLAGRRYFAIQADGFFGATENYVAEGTLSTGRIRYGMLDLKVFADLQWRTAPLPSDASVSAEVTSDTGETSSLSPQVSTASTVSALNRLGPMHAEWVEVTFTLTRGGTVTRALLLTGVAGDNASTPDPGLPVDLSITWHGAMDNWSPGGFGKFLAHQWPNVAGNNAYALSIAAGGELQLSWSPDGTAVNNETSPLPLGFQAGSEHWLRATLDVNNGAGGKRLIFETSENGTSWTTLDDRTEAGTTSIHNSTAALVISDVLPFSGYCRFAEVRDTITPGSGGTVLANPDFDAEEEGAPSFTDADGNTWTINNGASIGLVAGSDAEAPELRAWVLRAIPVPQTTQVFQVPIILRHKVQPPHGPAQGVHSDVELDYLAGLVATQAITSYQEGKRSYNVHVVNFKARGVDWDKTASHFETLCLVELHEI